MRHRTPGPGGRIGRVVLAGVAFLVFAYLAGPALIIVPMSFNSSGMLEFPPRGFSLRHYARYLSDPAWQGATLLSFRLAGLAALSATIIGTTAALGARRLRGRPQELTALLLTLPKFAPSIVTAIALYGFFITLRLSGSVTALVIAHTLIGIPLVFLTVYGGLSGFDDSLERAAGSLGAGPGRVLWHVTLPLIRPAVISGAIFAFVTSFDEVVIALFLAGPGRMTLPVKMWESIEFTIEPVIAAVSTLLILFSGLLLGVVRWVRGRAGGTAGDRFGEVPTTT